MGLPTNATPGQRAAAVGLPLLAGLVLFFLVAPIVLVVPLSFTAGELLVYPIPGWSLRWYHDFFTNEMWTTALRNSLVLAVITTVTATTLGTLAALGLHGLASPRLRALLIGLLVTPLVIPLVIVAVAIFYYYARLGLSGSFIGLVIAHTVLALPFVVVTVAATLQGFDRNLSRAAASLGARPATAFVRITLPLIAPGVISGALFAFVTSFDELLVVLFIASPTQRTLPRQIYSGVSESISPTVTAAAVVLVVVTLGLMGVVELLRRRAERLRTHPGA
jgi:putative spermidine/putrescine transport system permease protein